MNFEKNTGFTLSQDGCTGTSWDMSKEKLVNRVRSPPPSVYLSCTQEPLFPQILPKNDGFVNRITGMCEILRIICRQLIYLSDCFLSLIISTTKEERWIDNCPHSFPCKRTSTYGHWMLLMNFLQIIKRIRRIMLEDTPTLIGVRERVHFSINEFTLSLRDPITRVGSRSRET